jgi:hypothetical protein
VVCQHVALPACCSVIMLQAAPRVAARRKPRKL